MLELTSNRRDESPRIEVLLVADEDGDYEVESARSHQHVERSRERWEMERAIVASDLDLCPCDGHPSAECETCRGACSCHWEDPPAEWFERDFATVGEDLLPKEVLGASLEERAGRRVRVVGRMWSLEHDGQWGRDYDGGFEVESWEVLP